MASLPSIAACVGQENSEKFQEYIREQLEIELTGGSEAFSEAVANHPGGFGLGIGMVVFAAILLIVGFRFAPKLTTWSLSLLNVTLMAVLGVYLLVGQIKSAEGAGFLFAMAAIYLLILILKKKAVNEAAVLFKMSTYAVFANPGMLGFTVLIQFCAALFGVLILAGCVAGFIAGKFINLETTPDAIVQYNITFDLSGTTFKCGYQRSSWGSGASQFLSFIFAYIMFNFKMIRLYMVAVTTGFWYWDTDAQPTRNRSCTGLKWALSYGFGVVATAAIIISLVDKMVRSVKSKASMCLNCCNPIFWFFWVLVK